MGLLEGGYWSGFVEKMGLLKMVYSVLEVVLLRMGLFKTTVTLSISSKLRWNMWALWKWAPWNGLPENGSLWKWALWNGLPENGLSEMASLKMGSLKMGFLNWARWNGLPKNGVSENGLSELGLAEISQNGFGFGGKMKWQNDNDDASLKTIWIWDSTELTPWECF